MECTLKEVQDLSGAGITAMVIGRVQHISVEEAYAQGYELRYEMCIRDRGRGAPCKGVRREEDG